MGLRGAHPIGADDARDLKEPVESSARPATIVWQKVDRSSDGFKVEMPADVKEIQIPAYNESGGTEQVNMIFANPDAETTFSVAWEDDPPVARVNGMCPRQNPGFGRDGALARTQTTLVSETKNSQQGRAEREFSARNVGGGVMNSRLIFAGTRLYMLIACFPAASARRDEDVNRFFNSFVLTK